MTLFGTVGRGILNCGNLINNLSSIRFIQTASTMSGSASLRFDGKVVLVTGAGNGLGKEYALAFGARGAKVVVNDLGGDFKGQGQSSRPADLVVDEIKSKGGVAVANYDSVEEGEKLVKTALDNFGRIDVIVNNAGILRDKSFARITDGDWDIIQRVHLRGTFLVARAAWPHMKRQKYGRIINVASSSGIYGNFGQANYAAAKMGIIGLTNTLAIEGQKDNIVCNVIAPVAGSRLTQTVMPENILNGLKPEDVAPLVLWLGHEDCQDTGGVFECGAGLFMKIRWQRTGGKVLKQSADSKVTPEMIRDNWNIICDFDTPEVHNPSSSREGNMKFFSLIQSMEAGQPSPQSNNAAASDFPLASTQFTYNERDAIMYALGVGVSTTQDDYLKFLFESSPDFCVLPTYGVIPIMEPIGDAILKGDFKGIQVNPAMILHGEQYLEVIKPLNPADTLTSKANVVDVIDKGSGAVIITNVESFDGSGSKVLFGQTVIFVQKAGGFGGKRTSDKIIPLVETPKRTPDAVMEEKTSIDQAALYRLNGDKNPLHIDPSFSALAGFPKPILHGLCSFGYAARHVLKQYCDNDVKKFKSIKVRFTSPVLPGQTVRTEMWKDGNRVYIQCKVAETGKTCLAGAYVDLYSTSQSQSSSTATPTAGAANTDAIFEFAADKVKAKPELAKSINAVYLYNITGSGPTVQYTMDLSKESGGKVYKGKPEDHGSRKADCTLTISGSDFMDMVSGKAQGMKLFTSGKLKVSGNVMLTMKLESVFKELSKL